MVRPEEKIAADGMRKDRRNEIMAEESSSDELAPGEEELEEEDRFQP